MAKATQNDNTDQLAARLTDLEARPTFVERVTPHVIDARRRQRLEAQRVERVARARSISSLDEYNALSPRDRNDCNADTIVKILSDAERAVRQRVVEGLRTIGASKRPSLSWSRPRRSCTRSCCNGASSIRSR